MALNESTRSTGTLHMYICSRSLLNKINKNPESKVESTKLSPGAAIYMSAGE